MSFDLATMLRESRKVGAERPCVYFAGRAITYADIDNWSTAFSRGLRDAARTRSRRRAKSATGKILKRELRTANR